MRNCVNLQVEHQLLNFPAFLSLWFKLSALLTTHLLAVCCYDFVQGTTGSEGRKGQKGEAVSVLHWDFVYYYRLSVN